MGLVDENKVRYTKPINCLWLLINAPIWGYFCTMEHFMKKIVFGLALTTSLAMVGCASQAPTTTTQTIATPASQTVATPNTHAPFNTVANPKANNRVFDCQNGLQVAVQYLNDEQIALSSGNVSAVLRLAPSASGDRYVGNTGLWGNRGGEWHESGDIANFSYKGVHDSQVRQTNCQAQ